MFCLGVDADFIGVVRDALQVVTLDEVVTCEGRIGDLDRAEPLEGGLGRSCLGPHVQHRPALDRPGHPDGVNMVCHVGTATVGRACPTAQLALEGHLWDRAVLLYVEPSDRISEISGGTACGELLRSPDAQVSLHHQQRVGSTVGITDSELGGVPLQVLMHEELLNLWGLLNGGRKSG